MTSVASAILGTKTLTNLMTFRSCNVVHTESQSLASVVESIRNQGSIHPTVSQSSPHWKWADAMTISCTDQNTSTKRQ